MEIIGYVYFFAFLSWLVFEGYLIVKDLFRDQKHAQDQGTLRWLTFCISLAFLGGFSFINYARFFATDHYLTIYIFTLIALAGLIIRILAVLTLGKNFQRKIISSNDQNVTISGPFEFIRHPSYLGLILSVVGIIGAWGNIAATVFAFIIVVCGLVPRIILEEEYLSRNIPGYLKFMRKTKWRLVPFIW